LDEYEQSGRGAAALSQCARRSSLDQRSWSSSKPALGQVAVETLVEIA
jgi:hypothetical protein